MISVELEYRPFAFFPWTRRIEKKLPARWSEMNADQISSVPDLQSGKLKDERLLRVFFGLKKRIAKRIDSYQAFCISRYLKYIREPEPLGNFIISEIAGFRSPEPKLKGVTFGAFMFGDSYYSSYKKGKDADLDRFIACFYCDNYGFDDATIDAHAQKIARQRITTRMAIAINYQLIREWLAVGYPYVFQKTEGTASTKGWVDVFDKLVENDLGNQDKYAKLPVHTVLRNLDNRLKDYYKYGSKV